MKLGVFDPLFHFSKVETMLDKLVSLGLEAVELSTGGYVGKRYCNPEKLLQDQESLKAFIYAFEQRGLIISALSCHGNPLHPDSKQAQSFHNDWRNSVRLAHKLGIETVVTFSGCPGGSPDDRTPNWITCAWPSDYTSALEWQWEKCVIPYWRSEVAFAEAHNVRVAIEMHPGFVVYNPENLMRLRLEVGENLGANFDPSHLVWQGVDIVAAIRHLGNAIYHVHAKDTYLEPTIVAQKGVLDTTPYNQVAKRSWIFRSVGYGHGELSWRKVISALRTIGYDHVISIEHEDVLASREEGLKKAISTLQSAILREPPDQAWWA